MVASETLPAPISDVLIRPALLMVVVPLTFCATSACPPKPSSVAMLTTPLICPLALLLTTIALLLAEPLPMTRPGEARMIELGSIVPLLLTVTLSPVSVAALPPPTTGGVRSNAPAAMFSVRPLVALE